MGRTKGRKATTTSVSLRSEKLQGAYGNVFRSHRVCFIGRRVLVATHSRNNRTKAPVSLFHEPNSRHERWRYRKHYIFKRGLNICGVYESRPSSLPDEAEVVSVAGRRVSLLRFSGAGVQDGRAAVQGCSARLGSAPDAFSSGAPDAQRRGISVCFTTAASAACYRTLAE